MDTKIYLTSYTLTPLAKSSGYIAERMQPFVALDDGQASILSAREGLLALLQVSEGDKYYAKQASLQHVREGLLTMFDIMAKNAPITSAPKDEKERIIFYDKLAKGCNLLSEILKEAFKAKIIDKKDLYACLETLGDGGYACAERWRKGLEDVLYGFSDTPQVKESLPYQDPDPLMHTLIDLSFQARVIEANKSAEAFVEEHSAYSDAANRIHYSAFFKRYLNQAYNYQFPIAMNEDSFLHREKDQLTTKIQKHLIKNDMDVLVIQRWVSMIREKVKTDNPLYYNLLHYAQGKYHKQNLSEKYADLGDFLCKNVFYGYSRSLQREAVIELLKDKGLIQMGSKEISVDRFLEVLISRDQQDVLENVLKSTPKNCPNTKLHRFLNLRNHGGDTPLMVACKKNLPSLTEILIANGVDMNLKNRTGYTALMLSLLHGNTDIAHFLIEKGADLNVENRNGDTPLIWAAQAGDHPLLLKMIAHGAVLDLQNYAHETPLMWASHRGYTPLVKTLIENGANPNLTDLLGNTALMYAMMQGQKETVKILLQADANVTIKNNFGETAVSLAHKKGYADIWGSILDANLQGLFESPMKKTHLLQSRSHPMHR